MNLLISFLTLFTMFSCSINPIEPEIYILKKEFRGKVNVIYSKDKQSGCVYENGKRIFRIPNDGILLTPFNIQEGLIKREYFFEDDLGNRSRINLYKDRTDSVNIGVFRDGTIGTYGNTGDDNSFDYQEFYITNKDNFEMYFSMDSINAFEKKLYTKIDHLNKR